MAAQSAQIGVAQADFYPSIAINGEIYQASEAFSDLFRSASAGGAVGPSFSWNILNYGRIANNVRLLAGLAAPAKIMTILKADAYGHGLIKVARTVLNNGASWVGVATLGEAITLRSHGIVAPRRLDRPRFPRTGRGYVHRPR